MHKFIDIKIMIEIRQSIFLVSISTVRVYNFLKIFYKLYIQHQCYIAIRSFWPPQYYKSADFDQKKSTDPVTQRAVYIKSNLSWKYVLVCVVIIFIWFESFQKDQGYVTNCALQLHMHIINKIKNNPRVYRSV